MSTAVAPMRELTRLEVPAPAVAGPLEELRRFQQQFDALFVELAEQLPQLNADLQGLASDAASLQDSQRGLRGRIQVRTDAVARAFEGSVSELLGGTRAARAAAEAMAPVAGALADGLVQVERLSASVGRMGMNASFLTARTGGEGLAFAALTREMTAFARGCGRQALQIRDHSQSVRSRAEMLEAEQGALAGEVEALGQNSGEQSAVAHRDCVALLERFGRDLAALGDRAAVVLDSTRRIMLAVQSQDILRQGLDHVALVLRALDAEHRALASAPTHDRILAFLAFESRVGALAQRLLDSLRRDLDALLGQVLDPLEQLRATTAALFEQRALATGLDARLSAPARALAAGYEELHASGAAIAASAESVNTLDDEVSRLRSNVRELEQTPVQLRMIAVLMRLEATRTPSLQKATTLAAEIDDLRQRFQALQGSTASTLEQLRRASATARAALKKVAAVIARANEQHASVRRQVEDVEREARGAGEALGRLVGAGANLEARAADFARRLAAFREAVAATAGIAASCAGFASRADASLRAALGPAGAAPEAPERLRALVERFTVFEHKQLASDLTGVAVEAGDAGGELTLF